MTDPVALVLAKAPVPGRVKTRLGARVGAEGAARLAAAALHDTLDACESAFGAGSCYLALDGDLASAVHGAELAQRLSAWVVLPQNGAHLGARLAHAHRDVAALAEAPVIQVGMDTPQATAADLHKVASSLATADAVLGPAVDGGWWVLGLSRPELAGPLAGVAMSTARTAADTRAALAAAGARLVDGPTLRDVDDTDDADLVARRAPATRFARLWDETAAAVRP